MAAATWPSSKNCPSPHENQSSTGDKPTQAPTRSQPFVFVRWRRLKTRAPGSMVPRTCVARADADAGGDGGPRAARRGDHLLPPPRHDSAHGHRDPRGGQPRRSLPSGLLSPVPASLARAPPRPPLLLVTCLVRLQLLVAAAAAVYGEREGGLSSVCWFVTAVLLARPPPTAAACLRGLGVRAAVRVLCFLSACLLRGRAVRECPAARQRPLLASYSNPVQLFGRISPKFRCFFRFR